ncbi:twin-arginine translocation signal domain-containing protein, partial [Halorubrum sp. Atlit-28R]|uniref:twin-arginine translocation signal domain-containing protein n=1 Tax=Halorubrum sp. Atlit-28R TaxID=2282129 RepID=UPI000EF1E66F
MVSTRRSFIGGSAAALAGLAGCLTTSNSERDASSTGSGGGDAETYEVGYRDFQTNIEATAFPDMLYFYCVQSGWMNWPSLMQSFEDSYGVAVHDDDRSS